MSKKGRGEQKSFYHWQLTITQPDGEKIVKKYKTLKQAGDDNYLSYNVIWDLANGRVKKKYPKSAEKYANIKVEKIKERIKSNSF